MPSPETVHRPTATSLPDGHSWTATGTFFHSPPPLPQRAGAYQLLERIGRGGLGDVFRARPVAGGDEVALKLLRGGGEASPAERRSFQRELDTARRLSHPGILRILDAGVHDGAPFYTMPLMRGGSLEKKLCAVRLDVREGVALLIQMADAVHAAHLQGVIHRDLKPANVLLADDGSPRVADFGLARFMDQLTTYTATGQLMGSLPYMAPEQAAGRSHTATAATDVWALGVILYEILGGERPFRGDARADVLHRIQHDEPAALGDLRADVPRDLEAVCLRCLRKKPRDRFGSAADLADDLERWLAGEQVTAVSRASGRLDGSLMARPRPVLMAAGAVLFALTWLLSGLSGAAPASPEADPARNPEQAARSKLIRHLAGSRPGRPVELLSQKQRPIWARIVAGEDQTKFTQRPEQLPWLHTPGRCLIELLPDDPKRTDYRLTIEFTLERGQPGAYAGLYVAHGSGVHHDKAGDAVGLHAFAEAVFPAPNVKSPAAALHFAGFVTHPDGNVSSHRSQTGLHVDLPAEAGPARKQLRSFAIESRGPRVGIAAGQPTHWPVVVRERIALDHLARRDELHGVRPALSPTAPAGIVLWQGGIRIHRVLYEPVPAPR